MIIDYLVVIEEHMGGIQNCDCLLVLLEELSGLGCSVASKIVIVISRHTCKLSNSGHDLVDSNVLDVRVSKFVLENSDHLSSDFISELVEFLILVDLVDGEQ